MTEVTRRVLLQAGAGSAALGPFAPSLARAQAAKPIRIGCLNSFSKTFALLGQSNLNGMNLAFEEAGWKVAGRTIEVIREDDEISPQVGLQKIRKLVDSDGVDFVCGPQASNVALAVLNYMKQKKALLLISGAGVSSLTYERLPNMFRTSLSTWKIGNPMAGWITQNLTKDVFLSASDFAGGRDVTSEFKSAFLKLGGRVVGEVYPPLGTTDFSPYLANIRSSGAPATFNFYAGSDAARFVNQYAEFGLKDRIKMTGYAALVDSDTLPAQGKNAIGCLTANIYAESLDNPASKKFVTDYQAKYRQRPNLYSEYGYTTGRVILAALETVNGETADKDRLAKAIEAVRIDAPRGPFRFDPETHNPIQNVYLLEAVEAEGRVVNVARTTFPEVRDPGKAA